MPELTLRLEVDPRTRRRTVVVSYRSDPDALPVEHEEEHRALVEKLIAGGLVAAGDDVRVEREEPREVAAGASGENAETTKRAGRAST